MGHKASGWTVRQRAAGRIWTVRYCVEGAEGERSTGKSDREEALREGARIYAEEVIKASSRPKGEYSAEKKRRAGQLIPGSRDKLPALIGRWLSWLRTTHSPATLTIWELYASTHWLPFFGGIEATFRELTPERCDEYMRARLGKVRAVTVKKELTALRSFINWLEQEGFQLSTQNGLPAGANVPRLPKRAAGVKHTQRRRVAAFALSPDHVKRLIRALPEWSLRGSDKFPVRARFIIAYETSLRPSTLDRLETPRHYRAGESMLRLTEDTDKARWGRDVPLSKRARRVLAYVVRNLGPGYEGPIFGAHDYRGHIEKAAKKALPLELAERFCGAHLRSARITHLLEKPKASLPGVQHLAGHKLMSTTARYVKPSFRAALAALGEDDE